VLGPGHGVLMTRVDGSQDGFSHKKCFLRQPPSPWIDFNKACRAAVREQIETARARDFAGRLVMPCPVSGAMITPKTSHVDHAAPTTFKQLCLDFVAENGIDVGLVLTHQTPGKPTAPPRFADTALELAWQQYHARRAVLRTVSISVNLAKGAD
jgi:hypothetical protein